jgi:formylglycine-generating enzyme required for sulfatase activity
MALSQNTKYYLKIESDDGNGGVNQSEIDSFTTIFADLIYVEGGTFTMGCTSEQEYACLLIEKPSHSVTLSSYFIGKYEVTQSQWVSVMGTNPSIFQNCDDCPVEGVTWDVVQTFLIKLNIKTGKNYRLPT